MARTRRNICDNAFYHILNRGHDRRKLFSSSEDFKTFKSIILRYKKIIKFDVYNYCLMSNHFHLLLKVANGADLPYLMKSLCQSYANYFKKQYHLSGYLFQNRYKSILIDKDEYLLECGRYIERNPVRAGMVDNPSGYVWSSYNFYSKGRPDDIITINPLYTALSTIESERRDRYVEYVAISRPYEELLDEKISELK